MIGEALAWRQKPPLSPSCEAGKEWAMPILTAMSGTSSREAVDAAAH